MSWTKEIAFPAFVLQRTFPQSTKVFVRKTRPLINWRQAFRQFGSRSHTRDSLTLSNFVRVPFGRTMSVDCIFGVRPLHDNYVQCIQFNLWLFHVLVRQLWSSRRLHFSTLLINWLLNRCILCEKTMWAIPSTFATRKYTIFSRKSMRFEGERDSCFCCTDFMTFPRECFTCNSVDLLNVFVLLSLHLTNRLYFSREFSFCFRSISDFSTVIFSTANFSTVNFTTASFSTASLSNEPNIRWKFRWAQQLLNHLKFCSYPELKKPLIST